MHDTPVLQSQHDHSGQFPCPLCEKLRATQMLERSMPFSVAASLWLEDHKTYVKPGTVRTYRQYVKSLSAFFEQIPLENMHIGSVRAYQRDRLLHACAYRINIEVNSVLVPILKEVNLWQHMKDVYRPLPVEKKKVRQNMSEEEERRFIACALDASQRRRLVAGHCMIVLANTGMGFGEMRHLKREDVFLDEQKPYITVNEGTKNAFRIRTIPLNWLALRSMRWLLKRWSDLGGKEPTDYLLPHHGRHIDRKNRDSHAIFTEPMLGIQKAARSILKEAGLNSFKIYDMRSTFCTKLLSDPDVSDQTFRELFGHNTAEMRNRYSAQRLQKKAVAVEKLALDPAPAVKLIAFPGGRK